jgi:hypothetical protein
VRLAAYLPTAPLSGRGLIWTTLTGIAIGVAYTLSPLSIWFAVGTLLLGRTLIRDLDESERRVVITIFIIAIAVRLLVIAALFLSVDHWQTPFGSLFGDEEYFKRRSLWLRSMALDVNISQADRRYAFEEYSANSYLYVLAFLQVLVGDAPYGVHLFSTLAYAAGAVWLFRFCRRSFGSAPAALTFTGVLFLPTLFLWSVSALRESLHFLLTLAAIVGGVDAIADTRIRRRVGGLLLAVLAAYALKDLRTGSMTIVAGALLLGGAAHVMAKWRRPAVAAGIALLVVGAAVLTPAVQDRVLNALRATGLSQQGHAWTPGIHYKVLDRRFYRERTLHVMNDMTGGEAARYVVRALVAAAVEPWPWHAATRQLRAYLVEHVVWLVMIVLLPLGVWASIQRHPPAAFVMTAYVAAMFSAIALTSGNIGTLVRHRGLILPFVICLTAVGVCDRLARASERVGKGDSQQ